MKTYIRKSIRGYYIDFPEEIDAEYWEGKIGSTYEDFVDDKWILLSDEQVAFHEQNPGANIQQVITMTLPETNVRTLEDAKNEKLYEIDQYDRSSLVNGFEVVDGENSFTAWITPEQRSNYKNSIDAAELIGLDELHPIFNNIQLTISTQMAKLALAQIQLYADRCFIVTETHRAEVNALESIEAVDNYDVTAGYPERLSFTIN